MPINKSPDEWREYLELKLEGRKESIEKYEAYYVGEHAMQFATSKFKEAFGNLFGAFADNWCPIVVDSAVERLVIEGIRVDSEDGEYDKSAWEIWQANNMDAASVVAHTEAIKNGVAYVLVDPYGDGVPRITVEHPLCMIVEHDPADKRNRLAALKKWYDPTDGYLYCTLYLPDVVYKYRSDEPRKKGQTRKLNWVPKPGDETVSNPMGVVPVVPLENNPTMLKGGRSDLEGAIPVQDAINKLLSDMLVTSEYAAFPQRVVTGVEIPKDPITGEPLPDAELRAAISRTWFLEPAKNEDGTVGANPGVHSLPVANLEVYTKAVDTFVEHLAAQTRTPAYMMMSDMTNLSADAMRAAETGLIQKCKRKIKDFSEAWETVIQLVFLATGNTTAAERVGEMVWRDPQTHNLAQEADALLKKRQLGVPLEILWEELGYTPMQIERMKNLAGLPDRPPVGATTAQVLGPRVAEASPTRGLRGQITRKR